MSKRKINDTVSNLLKEFFTYSKQNVTGYTDFAFHTDITCIFPCVRMTIKCIQSWYLMCHVSGFENTFCSHEVYKAQMYLWHLLGDNVHHVSRRDVLLALWA